jgi:hypothetical protein
MPASEKTYVYSSAPDTNYAPDNLLRVSHSASGANRFSYMKFSTAYVPANATIEGADLKIYLSECTGSPDPNLLYVGRVTTGWNENTITYNNRPSSTAPVSGNPNCTNPFLYFNVKDMVNDWFTGQQPNYGLILYGPKTNTWERQVGSSNLVYITISYTVPDPTPPVQAPPPSNTPSGESTAPGDSSPSTTTAKPVSASKPASEATAPVDSSIQAPVLTSVKKNDKEIKTTLKEGVSSLEINQNDSLELIGTSFASARVVVFIGDIAFESTAGADGVWSVILDNKKVAYGENQVQAQAQKDGRGSEKVDFFKLKKTEEKQVITKSQKKNNNNLLIILGISGAALLLLILTGVLLNIKYHWVQKLAKKIKPKPKK